MEILKGLVGGTVLTFVAVYSIVWIMSVEFPRILSSYHLLAIAAVVLPSWVCGFIFTFYIQPRWFE